MSTTERRVANRIKTNLNARWEGVLARYEGVVTDISINGCFLLTVDKVTTKELIRLELELPKTGWIYLWAEVVYQIPEMGFALSFTGMTDAEEALLRNYIIVAQINAEA